MPLNPAPIQEPITRVNGIISPIWVQWLTNLVKEVAAGGGGGISDGNKGDITVSGSGAVWDINAGVVGTTQLGDDITTSGKALLDDANASAQRTTLGLGTAAIANAVDFAAAVHTHPESEVIGLTASLAAKQDTLVSGTNIKTINGSSVLGAGDLTVSAAVAAQQTTIDFGSFAYDAKSTVIDASVTSSTRIIPSLTIEGRDADELEMAPIVLSTFVTAGVGFDIYAYALQGADGQFKVNYIKA